MNRGIALTALTFLSFACAAEDKYPIKLPAPGGEVILRDADAKKSHDEWHYATVRRVGDMIYVSGVIVNRRPGEGNDVAAFKVQARRALEQQRKNLEAAGSDFQHVVMINSFHVWQGPNFAGTRDEQFWAFEDVIGEFMKPPYPAWTAVGTTGLLSDGGIIEIQLIAKVR
ncbi:MAG TPA: Rid family hydrolase [Steroidobacteraceae bacterium]|jgi:enamine deaminase RidA (YjgF/YER057c/UK114 family)|nr:Rid family hydrolase [Steroidobacteraceae bacterium]